MFTCERPLNQTLEKILRTLSVPSSEDDAASACSPKRIGFRQAAKIDLYPNQNSYVATSFVLTALVCRSHHFLRCFEPA